MNAPDSIDTFLPGCEGRERWLRERLLKARDYASAALQGQPSQEVVTIMWLIIETASRYAYRSVPIVELEHVRNTLLRLGMAASFFEREGRDG